MKRATNRSFDPELAEVVSSWNAKKQAALAALLVRWARQLRGEPTCPKGLSEEMHMDLVPPRLLQRN